MSFFLKISRCPKTNVKQKTKIIVIITFQLSLLLKNHEFNVHYYILELVELKEDTQGLYFILNEDIEYY